MRLKEILAATLALTFSAGVSAAIIPANEEQAISLVKSRYEDDDTGWVWRWRGVSLTDAANYLSRLSNATDEDGNYVGVEVNPIFKQTTADAKVYLAEKYPKYASEFATKEEWTQMFLRASSSGFSMDSVNKTYDAMSGSKTESRTTNQMIAHTAINAVKSNCGDRKGIASASNCLVLLYPYNGEVSFYSAQTNNMEAFIFLYMNYPEFVDAFATDAEKKAISEALNSGNYYVDEIQNKYSKKWSGNNGVIAVEGDPGYVSMSESAYEGTKVDVQIIDTGESGNKSGSTTNSGASATSGTASGATQTPDNGNVANPTNTGDGKIDVTVATPGEQVVSVVEGNIKTGKCSPTNIKSAISCAAIDENVPSEFRLATETSDPAVIAYIMAQYPELAKYASPQDIPTIIETKYDAKEIQSKIGEYAAKENKGTTQTATEKKSTTPQTNNEKKEEKKDSDTNVPLAAAATAAAVAVGGAAVQAKKESKGQELAEEQVPTDNIGQESSSDMSGVVQADAEAALEYLQSMGLGSGSSSGSSSSFSSGSGLSSSMSNFDTSSLDGMTQEELEGELDEAEKVAEEEGISEELRAKIEAIQRKLEMATISK